MTCPLQVGAVILIVSNVVLTLFWILQCHPIDAAWNMNIKGQCFSREQKLRIIMAQAGKILHPQIISSTNLLTIVKLYQRFQILHSRAFRFCCYGMFK